MMNENWKPMNVKDILEIEEKLWPLERSWDSF